MGKEHEVRDDDVAILEVTGECDAFNLPRFCAKVDGIFREGIRRVVLDLRELEFADSEMLGQLLKVQRRFREVGGGIVLLQPGRFVMRTLEVLGLGEIFTICRSPMEALRALEAGAMETSDDAHDARPERSWRIRRVC